MSREQRYPQPKPAVPAAEPLVWRGFVVRMGAGGTEHCRVALPESVMRQYIVGEMQPPNMRGVVAAKIEEHLSGDQFVEGRGWPK